ncbi:DMT family transporter [Jannaschia seohaensis]|uniref:EamA-like transporter family protein n=1 Tax=Jannaschia seohaensis TaxID=475081 RepID=A0A2Y9BXX9_9RHOB|nr:DMT family transporter [Jannaschia seohaensis]PWJ21232.1 EamA-like transporter family protein [Jannaschia seohaensis]SSA41642.1 EamA-like transporter family protein [Jannaschia seohaensis]
MSLWIVATLFAAAIQAVRFYLQKRISSAGLGPVAATFARFVYAPLPIALGIAAWAVTTGGDLPGIGAGFWPFAIAGGIAQILATICVVALFARRNFAVGIAFSKTAVLLTVVTGFLLLGELVTWVALAAMAVGFVGVLLLSLPEGRGLRANPFNIASALGLASGVFFSISAVGYRGASLAIETDAPLLRAAMTLCFVTLLQTALLAAWLAWRDRAGLIAVFRSWRATALVGLTSMLGSLGWFTAYTLQTAAYVNAVGQVELILSMLISRFALGERQSPRELTGIVLVGVSVVGLILLGA